jgi:hypothetical protein
MILQEIDLILFLQRMNIPHWESGKNVTYGWVNIQCPYCDDASNHLGINLQSKKFSCWRCYQKGDIISLTMRLFRLPKADAIDLLAKYPRTSRRVEQTKAFATQCRLPRGAKAFPPVPEKILDFIEKRSLSVENFLKYASHWTDAYDEMPCRIIFPMNYEGRMVSYVGRDFSGMSDKPYKNARDTDSSIPVKHLLFGFDEAPNNSVLVLVEGIIDKLKLGRRALATLGTRMTKEQVLVLALKNPKKIYFCFDTETEAQTIAMSQAQQIWCCPTEVIELNDFNDPGELSEEEGLRLMKQLV